MEMGSPGERGYLPPAVEPEIAAEVGDAEALIPSAMRRTAAPALPELAQPTVLRHFLRLSQMTMGAHVTPDASLGTCTMKYSPLVNEQLCRMPEMSDLHPLQDDATTQGILEIVHRFSEMLCEISGMDAFTFQPGGGAQGVFANACIIRAYHAARGEADQRTEIISTAFSHPVDCAAPAVAGFRVITLMPGPNGYVELDALKAAVSERTAGLMMSNPEDTGIFNPHVEEFTRIVHEAGGLCAYDQANANGILGITRARESGFDLCQFNLHKTFSVPHGSTGPACGAAGCTAELAKYLPVPMAAFDGERYFWDFDRPDSIGKVRSFLGNLQGVVRAYAWTLAHGPEGLRQVAETAVLNNNYLATLLAQVPGVAIPYGGNGHRLQEVRYSWQPLLEETGVGTEDVRRRIVDYGLQGYFTSHHPMLVPEPFTLEPSESWSRADLDEYAAVFEQVSREAHE
ncbi:MAG: aminomethyl-transferring glycine dehydrogenase subunit GcvPB, partial [Thermomicrobiales bacterium]|nr:aminomethyl-transferring glycine dehydrogenase subunit GcvPB [Thermomicrobiales bacterium]